MNKKLFLLVLVLCISIIFIGCKNTPKAPDNFDKDLWKDSIHVIEIIQDTYEKDNNFSVDDENIIKEYFSTYENRLYDNIEENKLINSIGKMYEKYNTYLFSKKVKSKSQSLDKQECENIFKELQNQYEDLIK